MSTLQLVYLRNTLLIKDKYMDSILLEDNPHWLKLANEVVEYKGIEIEVSSLGDFLIEGFALRK